MIEKSKKVEDSIKKIAAFIIYGKKETIAIFTAILLFSAAKWLLPNVEIFKSYKYSSYILLSLYVVSVFLIIYAFYRFAFKIAIPKPFDNTKPLPKSIKGLMSFTDTEDDGELFSKLERKKELIQLNNYVQDKQTPFVVIMGESGAGKTSLLRAGLSHILKNSETVYIYWEAMPNNPVENLLYNVGNGLGMELTKLSELLHLQKKVVIILDQFEQLLPENPKHVPIFDLLKDIIFSPPPHNVTWFAAFRREYLPNWKDFEIDNRCNVPTVSLKLFSVAQAANVITTLAEEAGLTLEKTLVDSFVNQTDRLSPVEISIALLMLNELAARKNVNHLSLSDYTFEGGFHGLFVSFLSRKIEERFSDKKDQESLCVVLLELISSNGNQRHATGKTADELYEKAKDLTLRHLEYALNYFADGNVRILEKIIYPSDNAVHYRLPHESMIPALRQLGNKILGDMAQTDIKLQIAYGAWQSSNKDKRYLLEGKVLKAALKFKNQIDLSDKKEFLELSKKKKRNANVVQAVFIIFIAIVGYFAYDEFVELQYRNSLKNWGLPEDLRQYSQLDNQRLKALTIIDNSIRSLNWLDTFKNLTVLKLRVPEVSDIGALKELKNLTSLNLYLISSQVSDIGALKELKNLTSLNLDLRYSQVSDIGALKELKNLTSLNLDLSSSQVSDIGALKELKNLTSLNLDLRSSQVSDIGALKELKNLTSLNLYLSSYLSDSQVSDIGALKELKNLTSLNLELSYSQVSDIGALKELKNLTSLNLDLSSSQVSDIGALKDMEVKNFILNIRNNKHIKYLKNLNTVTELIIGN